jgi:hypothetical protein
VKNSTGVAENFSLMLVVDDDDDVIFVVVVNFPFSFFSSRKFFFLYFRRDFKLIWHVNFRQIIIFPHIAPARDKVEWVLRIEKGNDWQTLD